MTRKCNLRIFHFVRLAVINLPWPTLFFADKMPIICGGQDNNQNYLDLCQKYNPASDSWHQIGTMPSARAASASAYVENFGLVMAGGYNHDEGPMDSVIVTPDGSSFLSLASLPAADYRGCLAVVDEQTLLLTGGSNRGAYL